MRQSKPQIRYSEDILKMPFYFNRFGLGGEFEVRDIVREKS
jgi:hypothetical protein